VVIGVTPGRRGQTAASLKEGGFYAYIYSWVTAAAYPDRMDDRSYTWDPAKHAENCVKHGLDFEVVRRFEWERAVAFIDGRHNYGEVRRRAYGPIDGRLCVLVFTVRDEVVRVISLRKANRREVRRYGQ
jgi:uncharacterized DUF497 family protein